MHLSIVLVAYSSCNRRRAVFGPGSAGKLPAGGVSIAESECEPWSSCLLSGCCKTIQPDKQEGTEDNYTVVTVKSKVN